MPVERLRSPRLPPRLGTIASRSGLPLLGRNRLAIYLNDHLAAATGAVALARRVRSSNRTNTYGATLSELAGEIERDRRVLIDVMERLSVGPDRLKITASWMTEKIGRLKLNGELVHYSPLSRLEELELLWLGVQGKLSLWEALRITHGSDARLRGVDFDEAIARARSQRRRLDRLRRRAALDALGDPDDVVDAR
jgi:hypothetical protein